MIDEIDTGLHHSVMSDMWHVLIATAKRLDLLQHIAWIVFVASLGFPVMSLIFVRA
jgi:AAA15 family ATPase/GTPase